ncbi:MAG TPA: glycosyltransferase family 39 protein, partial [Pyrinomonadaceae bacterium]|nr:glycosyltransferase family 39 protein [Pyrinomonadaceae bacterium]
MDEAGQTKFRLSQSESSRSRLLHIAVFTLIVSIYAGARLWHLTSACLWFDEIFSVHAARYGWVRMLNFVAADVVHPPLFYGLLKIWIGIGGESLIWLRLLPALLSVVAIVPFVLLCRELRVRQAELYLALLFMAVNGYLIKYAQEVRMYSLLLLLTLCSLWLFVKLLRSEAVSRRQLLILFAINLLLVYTHYYGWMVVVVEGFYLYLRGNTSRRQFLI